MRDERCGTREATEVLANPRTKGRPWTIATPRSPTRPIGSCNPTKGRPWTIATPRVILAPVARGCRAAARLGRAQPKRQEARAAEAARGGETPVGGHGDGRPRCRREAAAEESRRGGGGRVPQRRRGSKRAVWVCRRRARKGRRALAALHGSAGAIRRPRPRSGVAGAAREGRRGLGGSASPRGGARREEAAPAGKRTRRCPTLAKSAAAGVAAR